jgi:hypothetical protein
LTRVGLPVSLRSKAVVWVRGAVQAEHRDRSIDDAPRLRAELEGPKTLPEIFNIQQALDAVGVQEFDAAWNE